MRLLQPSGIRLSLPNRKTRPNLSTLFCQSSDNPARTLRWHLSMLRHYLIPEIIIANAGGQAIYKRVLAAQRHDDRWQEGWLPQALGRIALETGDLATAEGCFERARHCRQESGEAQNLVSDLLWLGRPRLAQQWPQETLTLTTAAINQLEAGASDYFVYETWDVYLGQAEVLAGLGQPEEAVALIQRAYTALLAFADQIPDDGRRHAFLAARPLARLLRAYQSATFALTNYNSPPIQTRGCCMGVV